MMETVIEFFEVLIENTELWEIKNPGSSCRDFFSVIRKQFLPDFRRKNDTR